MGDWVLCFPALDLLCRTGWTVDGLCRGGPGRLAVHLGLIERLFSLESAAFLPLYAGKHSPAAVRLLAPYSAVVAVTRDPALVDGLRAASIAPVHVIPLATAAPPGIHAAAFTLSHIETGLLGGETGKLPERSPAATAVRRRGRRLPVHQGSLALLHPGSGSLRKNWPLDRFLELARRLASHFDQVRFIAGPAEEGILRALADTSFAGDVIVPSDTPVLADTLSEADVYVGNDSGVSHLAGFLGLPTVAVFGPSDPERWRPVGPHVAVVAGQGPDCRPCFETAPGNCVGAVCLASVSVAEVLAAVQWVMAVE